jgi:predicted permease
MTNSLVNFSYFIRSNPNILVILGIWELFWKGMALWRASQNKQRNWFIGLLVINTIGILPIIYLKFFQKKIVQRKDNKI